MISPAQTMEGQRMEAGHLSGLTTFSGLVVCLGAVSCETFLLIPQHSGVASCQQQLHVCGQVQAVKYARRATKDSLSKNDENTRGVYTIWCRNVV